jgi:hypothetical protein
MSTDDGRHDPDPYWHEDLAIAEGRFDHETHTVRLRLHRSAERISWVEALFSLSAAQQADRRRLYFHGRPYILLPDYTVTIAPYPRPTPSDAIGAVTGARWEGLKHEDVGKAQAWYYPIDRTLVLWECVLDERFRQADPRQDETLQRLWAGFERAVLERCPGAERVYTTWEDSYARPIWREFLGARGYRAIAPAAFVKEVDGG